MNFLLIPIATVLCAVFNRIRGGGLKDYRPDFVSGAWIAGVVYGVAIYLYSWNWMAAVAVAITFIIGECFGWTKWINCIPGILTQEEYLAGKGHRDGTSWLTDDTGESDGTAWIAKALVDEKKDYWKFCFVGFVARGFLWWIPVFGALWWFGLVSPIVAGLTVLVISLLFPVVYYIGYHTTIFEFKYLQKAETIYGAVYGAGVGLALMLNNVL